MADPSTRRDVLKGAALAAAAVTATTANAATARNTPPAVSRADPRNRYTKAPFPEQTQAWPGLQRDMQPVPDCGETSYRGAGRLAGSKALVTGGDSGIGRAAAIAFSREGADIAINYLREEEPDAQDVAALLRGEGRKVVLLPGDLTDQAFCQGLVTTAARELGGLDILVNNAGYGPAVESITDLTPQQFDKTMKTNVYALFYLCKAAVSVMKPGSAIINTASVNSVDPRAELLDYSASKGAVLVFTKALAKQLADRGIRVNAVAPGPFWTPLLPAGGQLPGKMHEFGQKTPFGRAGQPAEIAPLYVALADAATSFTSGSVYSANGGTSVL